MIAVILLLFSLLFTETSPVLAISSPSLSSPSNGSTTSSSSLTWEAVDGSNDYRIIVDDSNPPTSPYLKDTYTTSTKYTPQLDPGTYYWKVEARDSSNNWSSWSDVWSFTLGSSNSSSSSSSNNQTTSSPTPASQSTSSFTISGNPSSISSDQSFSATVDLLLPNNPNAHFYLKGAFIKSGGSNYFGQTKVNGSWIKNGSSYSSQLSITTDSSGHWSGSVDVMPDGEDSGFTGSGAYTFKIARYSDSGSGPTWSNETSLNINGVAASNTSSSSTSKSTTTTSSPIPTTSSKNSYSSIVKSPVQFSSNSGTVAGIKAVSTDDPSPTSETKVKGNTQINFLPFLGGGLILIGAGFIVYIFIKQRYNS